MDAADLISQAKRIIQSRGRAAGVLAEAREFLRVYAGAKSSFLKTLNDVDQTWSDDYIMDFVTSALEGFIRYVENDLLEGISIERKAQIDVVSDFLEQANSLLSTKGVHPATPTVIIGASLEEFLRNWVEEANLSLGNKKPGLDSYTKILREADLITKQDAKDLTSWAGLRNHAAHGEWDEVNDKKRVSIMLEGVNLFMRKYGRSGI
ncbi:MAG: hypothetical protein ACNYWU_09120 [Desulfobacterales bacterium]